MKLDRHQKILEIIARQDIETQEDLAAALNAQGFQVTQATVSRDIRELKLSKVSVDGKQKYAALKGNDRHLEDKYRRVLKEGFYSMDTAQNILVIKTVGGMAMAVAAALDAFGFDEIVGTIAGDDTIMCAIRTTEDARRLMEKIYGLLD